MYIREAVNRLFAKVCYPLAWITQLFTCFQKVEEHIRLLEELSEEEKVMEIDISEMHNYYETVIKMHPNYLGKSLKINGSNQFCTKNGSTLLSVIARYLAKTFGLQLANCKTIS
jgi:hypothetical protein